MSTHTNEDINLFNVILSANCSFNAARYCDIVKAFRILKY